MPYLGLIVLLVWIVALIDLITADEHRVRHLPKLVWLLIVIIIPLAGSIIWFLVGRPERIAATPAPRPTGLPEHQNPRYQNPDYLEAVAKRDDEEFRRKVRERAEEQRRRAKALEDERAAGDSDDT
ncbi:MAG: PLD nuclease N-terminal domain-containing protein [Gordonia sp. (in: high G+C Gram-positive bacteria)]|uniref:PLD nuclease N-terminal domain-containing protein n=1 Tax=Gordonia sp. (in: high G+C Gram-positive bacteria) TaxID=84139 RepID=UPI0039E30FF1